MKKLLLLVFAATLVLFFTPNTFAQSGKSVKVANNYELSRALNNSNIKSVEITQDGFYDALLLNAHEGTFIFKGNGSRANCQFWINTRNVCFDGDTTTNVAQSGVNSVGGAICPGVNEGHWTVISQPAGSNVVFMDPLNMDTMHFYVDQPGIYELRNSWYQTPGDPSTSLLGSAQTQYTFFSVPVITDLSAAPDSVCGLSTTINFDYDMGQYLYGDTTVTWTVNGADSSAVYPKVPGSFTFTVPSCGEYTLNLHVTNSLGCGDADSTITIYFFDEPVVTAHTSDTLEVCGNGAMLFPTVTANCTNGVTLDSTWSGTGLTFVGDSAYAAGCGTYTAYLTIKNGPCTATDSVVLKFFDTPDVTAHVTDTVEVCGRNVKLLPTVTVGCTNGGTIDSVWSGTGLQFVGDSAFATTCGTYTAYLTITNGPCSNMDSVVIKFYDTPNVTANIGADTVKVCGNGAMLYPEVIVACDNGSSVDSVWSGTGLTFAGDSAYAATCGTYTAYLDITVGPCTNRDSVVLKFYDTPVVDAGVGDTLCATGTSLAGTHVENCDNGDPVTVLWTKVSGPGTVVFADATNNNTDVAVDTCGLYTFRFTVTNGPCVDSADVSFYFTDDPEVTLLMRSDTVCGFDTYATAFYNVNCGIGDTAVLSGTGPGIVTIVYDANASSDNYSITVDTCGDYTFLYHVTNGDCVTDSTFHIVFFQTPDPTIVGDDTVYTCSTVTYTVADPGCNDPNDIKYEWFVSGGSFAGGVTTPTTPAVDVDWDQTTGGGILVVHTSVDAVNGCDGWDTIEIEKIMPSLEGQVKYWNSVETYMPSPFATSQYCGCEPFDYFYVILAVDQGNGLMDLDTAIVQPRLMEDLTELMSYFNFDLLTDIYGCDAQYFLRVWDGGFVYHNNPPPPADKIVLGHTYTYNNWGGVNATDALAIQLMAVNTQINAAPYNYTWVGDNNWSPDFGYYSQGIADVNHTLGNVGHTSSGITALDALTAKYRAVGLLGSYPDNSEANSNQFRPNFVVTGRMVPSLPYITFPTPFDSTHVDDVPFTHSGNEYMYFQNAVDHKYTSDSLPWAGKKNFINLYYESVGDVNASYIPPGSGLKAKSALGLTYEGLASTAVGEVMTIPISVENDIDAVGAITLSFNYRNDLIEVLRTNFSDDDIFINQEEGTLNIGWFSTNAIEFNADATIAQIRVRVLSEIPVGTELFELNAISELADANAQPIAEVNLKTIGVTTKKGIIKGSELTTSNFPNPFNDYTTISYTLPENGKVKVEVYNSVGMLVNVLVDEYQESGVNNVRFNSSNVEPGVYVYHITVQGETNNYTAVKRMIVVH